MASDRTPENCGHQRIERFTTGDNIFSIWACGDCSLRFYPACPVCVDVGHRNVIHPVIDPEVAKGLADVEAGRTKPWAEVRARLVRDGS